MTFGNATTGRSRLAACGLENDAGMPKARGGSWWKLLGRGGLNVAPERRVEGGMTPAGGPSG
jgi:hypothetical protein